MVEYHVYNHYEVYVNWPSLFYLNRLGVNLLLTYAQ